MALILFVVRVIREIRGNEKNKGNHEKSTIVFSSQSVRLWMSHAHGGVYCPATSRDSSQRTHRLRRDIDFQREFDRDRLSLSLSRVMRIFWETKIILFTTKIAVY